MRKPQGGNGPIRPGQRLPAAQPMPPMAQAAIGHLKARRFPAAEQAARAAITQMPRAHLMHNVLGIALGEQNRHDEAMTAFRKAVKLAPDNHEYLRNVGLIEIRQKRYAEAARTLRKAIALRPDYAQGHLSLGTACEHLDDYEGAIAHFTRAFTLIPTFGEAYAGAMHLAERNNDLDQLRALVARADEHIPGSPYLVHYQGVLAQRDGDLPRARELFESIRFDKPPVVNINLHVARCALLGKICDKLGDYDKAFEYFRYSNHALTHLAHAMKLDPRLYLAETSRIAAYFEAGKHLDWPALDLPDTDAPVFMVGYPRSGTTLLDTILRSHPQIEVIEERPTVSAMMAYARAQAGAGDHIDWLGHASADELAKMRQIYLDERARHITTNRPVIIDKLPLNTLAAAQIARVFPGARFIFSLRHPADAVLSCFMQSFEMNSAMAVLNHLDGAARLYDHTLRIWTTVAPTLKAGSVTVRYENLIADLEGEVRPVIDYLGLDWDDALLDYRSTAAGRQRIKTPSYTQVVQPLYADAKYRWRHYASHMAPVRQHLDRWIEHFGYPGD